MAKKKPATDSNKKTDIGDCHYHICRKRATLHRCKYCGNYFCSEHARPSQPGVPDFESTAPSDMLRMREWHNSVGHPCTAYDDFLVEEKKRKDLEYDRALDRLSAVRTPRPLMTPARPRAEPITGWNTRETSVGREWDAGGITKIIAAAIVLIVSGYLLYYGLQSGQIQSLFDNASKGISGVAGGIGNFISSLAPPQAAPYEAPQGDGCPTGYKAQNGTCIPKYETEPKAMSYPYVLRGHEGRINLTVYGGLKQYLAGLPRSFTCYDGACPTDNEIQLSYITEPIERPYILALADDIRNITLIRDDQARIAISLVQNMPYDWAAANSDDAQHKYPYETLYDSTGICGTKSVLLVSLLKELGFGTALFEYDAENHMAVGIKCPDQYAYRGTGYCFIESTAPTIITFSSGEYIGAGKLISQPEVIKVSDGASFLSVREEYNDAARYNQITEMGPLLDMETYNEWVELSNKYGMSTNSSSDISN